MGIGKTWTIEEKEILQDDSKSVKDLRALLPHRSEVSIQIKRNRLGLHVVNKKSKYQDDLMNDYEFSQVIDGELLGDGCVMKDKRGYYSFQYCTVDLEYITYLHDYLKHKTGSCGLIHSYTPKEHYINNKKVVSEKGYSMSISHKIFEFFYNRWYKPTKEVPCDLRLTPLMCKHWYIGDGTLPKNKKPSLSITLCTHAFSCANINYLICQLGKLNIIARMNVYSKMKSQYVIRINGKYVILFLNMVGNSPTHSYEYKWDTQGFNIFTRRCVCGTEFSFCSLYDNWKLYCSYKCYQKEKNKRSYQKKKCIYNLPDVYQLTCENVEDATNVYNKL